MTPANPPSSTSPPTTAVSRPSALPPTTTAVPLRPVDALRVRDLRVVYDGTEVLGGTDLDLRAGEWLGLIGPNGSGKSTLLRALVGLVPSTGTVELGTGSPPGPTDLSHMPQNPELPPGMTVVEYVLLGRTAHVGWLRSESATDRKVATDVLRRLGLTSFAGRSVRRLSGGEAQRVVIARAWPSSPRSCSSTSRPAPSTWVTRSRCSSWSTSSAARTGSPSSRPCTTWTPPRATPTGWRCSTVVSWSRWARPPRCSSPPSSPGSTATVLLEERRTERTRTIS
ncbi:hypothetical protein BJF81_08240 [Ornithinimicrobium sp. CNJ-824]|uniref:ABC transporter ATP-binding protein n=1 Tax=Ornithinimicrobium sp. CNJ-824 TaxID=1904966 RepID=UPI00095D81C1|nr:ABC transporter ATP-binding protein [Ornithinimicrobium sp. CNJ-824]OLT19510.1 hypothetical protein BJF81_08240 [Ornithinimicrobium sp. CNJ-824]